MSQIPMYIAFDTALKPRGRISQNYKTLKTDLENAGFVCFEFAEFPITRANLAACDILVFACPDFAKIQKDEIDAVKHWVTEDGGGLLMLSHAGGDKGRRSNLSELAEQFSMVFENDQVLDKNTNLGVENLPIINAFPMPHPITEGITSLCFRAGCSLMNMGSTNIAAVNSNPESEPSQSALIMAGEVGNGRVVAMGSYEIFRDKMTGGYGYESHAKLALNMMGWLRTSKREQLRAANKLPVYQGVTPAEAQPMTAAPIENGSFSAPIPAVGQIYNPTMAAPSAPSGFPTPISVQSNIKIVNKEELFKAFQATIAGFFSFKEHVMQGFEVLKTNLETLMQAVWASEQEMKEVQVATAPTLATPQSNNPMADLSAMIQNVQENSLGRAQSEPNAPTPVPTPNSSALRPPPGLSPPGGFSPAPTTPTPTPSSGSTSQSGHMLPQTGTDLPNLSPMPRKPGLFGAASFNPGPTIPSQTQSTTIYTTPSEPAFVNPPIQAAPETPSIQNPSDYNSAQTALETVQPDQTSVPESSGSLLGKSKEELQSEMTSLENKLNSFRDLRVFVDKKLEGGKLTQPQYEKQIKKLESDINKTKYNIDELKERINKM